MTEACGLEMEPDDAGEYLPSVLQTGKWDLPARTIPYYAHLPDLRAREAEGGMKQPSIYIKNNK